MDADEVFGRVRANRLLAADTFAGLTDEQWRTPSLCTGWTVRDVAGHLCMPLETSLPTLLLRLVRERGSLDRTMDAESRAIARRPVEQLVATLRDGAGSRRTPPGVGPLGPLTDICVHLRDAMRPLGLPVSPPLEDWRRVLDHLVSPAARRGFVPRGRLDGLALIAQDQDWSWGDGASLSGPSEALALAVLGRPVALAELSGHGGELLGARIARR